MTANDTPMPKNWASDMERLTKYLISSVESELQELKLPPEKQKEVITQVIKDIYDRNQLKLPDSIREQLFQRVHNEVLGYGPIQPLLEDEGISEIMINGSKRIYIEKAGRLTRTNIVFDDDDHLMKIINHIISPLGRSVDADSPAVDARLPDGSRVNIVIPPCAMDGPMVTIRKFRKEKLTIQQLIEYGSITPGMVEFLRACVIGRLNTIISGGTGSGKTTLLNVLSGYIPEDERIVTIEDTAELQLRQDHVVRLESQKANARDHGEVTIRYLVRNALRMRPDRIIIGECRSEEALDMLQAMNTGHDGSLTTIHANSPRDALSRLETLIMMAGMDLPIKVVRQQISSAIDLIVQVARVKDGSRKLVAITEVAGMEGDMVVMSDIFKFTQTGVEADGKIVGEMKPTGIRPLFGPRLEAAGFKLGPELFGATMADMLLANRQKR
jgi:pilus assembly protein CpaF